MAVNVQNISKLATFNSASDEQIPIVIQFPNVTGVQPSIVTKSFECLFLVVQVTHEDVTTIKAHLTTNTDKRSTV